MILTTFYVHPPNSGCQSGKDAGSLIYSPGEIAYRAPTGALYPAPAQVPFGDGLYDIQPPEVTFVQPDGTRVRCDQKYTTETDHYVGTSGPAAWQYPPTGAAPGNSSINVTDIPNNDAFNTMALSNQYSLPTPVYRPVQGAHKNDEQLRIIIAILVIIVIVYVVARSAKASQ